MKNTKKQIIEILEKYKYPILYGSSDIIDSEFFANQILELVKQEIVEEIEKNKDNFIEDCRECSGGLLTISRILDHLKQKLNK